MNKLRLGLWVWIRLNIQRSCSSAFVFFLFFMKVYAGMQWTHSSKHANLKSAQNELLYRIDEVRFLQKYAKLHGADTTVGAKEFHNKVV